jgi:hypothetical protein
MSKIIEQLNHTPIAIKAGADGVAISVAGTAFFTDIMPAIAITLSVLWLSLQIFTWFANKKWQNKNGR